MESIEYRHYLAQDSVEQVRKQHTVLKQQTRYPQPKLGALYTLSRKFLLLSDIQHTYNLTEHSFTKLYQVVVGMLPALSGSTRFSYA